MVMSFGRNVEKSYIYNVLENSQIKPLARTDQIKDLRILLDERLSFRDHINDKIKKAFSMLGIIKHNFKHLTIHSFTMLYKNMVRSHLDYCSTVWSPYMKKDIEALEKVQKRATKILPQLKHMNYSDRLKACKLPTLHYGRIWGDMIETYKILTGKYDIKTAPSLVGIRFSVTRGHSLKLQKIGQNMMYVIFVLLIE